ncbi:MAG TPA: bifunctional 4-hydroxy-2-oxoglutarate aldolase/2-dehydro-3-deoxy-phosphogluconate aldolase [Verrucomicrobiae bacterium]
MRADRLHPFFDLPLVGILRGCSLKHLPPLLHAVKRGGLRYLEITMNSPGAEDQIRSAVELSNGSMVIGAGTVTSTELLNRALAAGAEFTVTPYVVPEVIKSCEERGVPIFPGALTPTEIYEAWSAGPASIRAIKIFPADVAGPKYIRALKSGFPNVRLMPTGGVDLASLSAFTEAGADAFGIGSPLFRKDRIDAEDWDWLEHQTRAFVDTYQSANKSVSD